MMLNVYDLNRKKTAVLQNAMQIVETQELNAVYSLKFELPFDDPKNEYCQPYHYVRYGDQGQLYRLTTQTKTINESGTRVYHCEHVIATLVDDVLFGSFVVGNTGITTDDVIRWVLDKQTAKRWVLGTCEFSQQLEYGWEHESLIAALYSIPKSFIEPYLFEFDTNAYPWKVNLKKIDTTKVPEFYIRAEKNLLESTEEQTSLNICTRLYGLGYGEGVNQLTIKDANEGKPYVESPAALIEKYGLISRIFVDRSFENAESLKERMLAILRETEQPQMTRAFNAADLYELTNDNFDNAVVGKVVMLEIDKTKTYITKTEKTLDSAGDMRLELSTKSTNIADTIADIANRQRIEQVYSQGATQLYAQSLQTNATMEKGAKLSFYIPDEMRIVNSVKAKIELGRFRAFNRQTKGGGGQITTSSNGGGSTQTSSSSGGAVISSSADGAINKTSGPSSRDTSDASVPYFTTMAVSGSLSIGDPREKSANETEAGSNANGHKHRTHVVSHDHTGFFVSHSHGVEGGSHSHRINHTHEFNAPSHTHQVSTSSHSHSVSIPDHSHNITLNEHQHEIEQGIFEYGAPSSASIWIGGVKKIDMSQSGEFDFTPYLLNSSGKIPRGSWVTLEIKPNDLAYITINLFVQGFVQSRGGGNY